MQRSVLSIVLLATALSVAPLSAQSTVLFDEGHGQRFLVGQSGQLDLSELAAVLRQQGFVVATIAERLAAQQLNTARAVVISGPFGPLGPDEVDALVEFLREGGTLVVMLHIPTPLSQLLHRLGVAHSNGVVRERQGVLENEPLNFRVTSLQAHPLMRRLSEFSIYGSWALLSENEASEVIAASSPDSWVDLNGDQQLSPGDAVQSFGLVVAGKLGRGRFVVFGDDALFQNRFLTGQNLELAHNLAAWLSAPEAEGRIASSEPSPGRLQLTGRVLRQLP